MIARSLHRRLVLVSIYLFLFTAAIVGAINCIDSDGEQNPSIRGSCLSTDSLTYGAAITYLTDYCVNSSAVREAYCSERGCSYLTVPCPSEQACLNGACSLSKSAYPTGCVRAPPSVAVYPYRQYSYFRQGISYSVAIKNNDKQYCTPSMINLFHLAGDAGNYSMEKTVYLAPNQSTVVNFSVLPSANATPHVNHLFIIYATANNLLGYGRGYYIISEGRNASINPPVEPTPSKGMQCNSSPAISINPGTQYGTLGRSLAYIVNVQSTDNSSCSPSVFNLTPASIPYGWRAVLSAYALKMAPGELRRVFLYMTPPTNIKPCGSYYFGATAVNSMGASKTAYAIYEIGGVNASVQAPSGYAAGKASLVIYFPELDAFTTALVMVIVLIACFIIYYFLQKRKQRKKQAQKQVKRR
ncbi:hypothetical protein HY991_01415 [Candidatus Micrarchaeota archaeon]|nr:hypothetical protein [Candidatus Micrarchaeota archaeon]